MLATRDITRSGGYLPLGGGTLGGALAISGANLIVRATTEKTMIGAVSGLPGIWFGNVTPSVTNYAMLYVVTEGPIFNAPSGEGVDFRIANNRLGRFYSSRFFQPTPASAPTDGDLGASMVSFYLDESGNNLKVRAKYANGTTLKTGTLALV